MAPPNLFATLAIAACALSPAAAAVIRYSTVTGYFMQDLNTTDPSTFDYTAANFGLLNKTYSASRGKGCPAHDLTQWQNFDRELRRLNNDAADNVEYRILFLGRHGEGWHNAAETYYGTPAWNCYWSLVTGNATARWEDPLLTADGTKQAVIANQYWNRLITEQKITTPESYYVSPLQRCLATAQLTFGSLDLPSRKRFKPVVKEFLREGISIHTCDHRSNKTYIHQTFPSFTIEDGFVEFDPYWNGVTHESSAAQDLRSKSVLDDIFSNDDATWISITSHSGEIASILRVVGHRSFSLRTGAVIPVLVKAETLRQHPTPTSATWDVDPHCTQPPITSLATGGCVCQASATPVTTALVTLLPTVTPIQTFYPPSPDA